MDFLFTLPRGMLNWTIFSAIWAICLTVYFNIGWILLSYYENRVWEHKPLKTLGQKFMCGGYQMMESGEGRDFGLKFFTVAIWPFAVVFLVISSWTLYGLINGIYYIGYGLYYLGWLIFWGGGAKLLSLIRTPSCDKT